MQTIQYKAEEIRNVDKVGRCIIGTIIYKNALDAFKKSIKIK